MVRRITPAHILQLDDLPKVAEADGVVYPIFLRVRDVARLFNVEPEVARRWVSENDLPMCVINNVPYVDVAALNDWITANSYNAQEYEQHWREIRHKGQEKRARAKAGYGSEKEKDLGAWGDEDE